MKKIVTLTVAALALGASMAMAAGGVNLAQTTCWGAGGTNTATFACNTNSGSIVLYGSVVVPANLTTFIGVATIMDIQVNSSTLPAWWLTQTGGCRANAISQDYAPANMDGACPDIWGGNAPLPVAQIQNGVGGPNRVRINGGAALTIDVAQNIVADGTTELNVYRVSISKQKSASASACAGCTTGACLVMNEIQLVQPAGVGNYRVSNPAGNNFVSYNGGIGVGACPGTVPAVNKTWGAVKALYR